MDAANLYAMLRGHTAVQLGYDAEKLTPSHAARLDMVCGLKLEADRLAGSQLRGEAVDPKQLLMVGEALEIALRPAEHAAPEARFGASHQRRLRALVEATLMGPDAAERDARDERLLALFHGVERGGNADQLRAELERLLSEALPSPPPAVAAAARTAPAEPAPASPPPIVNEGAIITVAKWAR